MDAQGQNPDSQVGRGMIWLAALGLLGGLFLFFSMLEEETNTVVSIDAGGAAMIVLEQDRSGHYLVEGQINHQAVNFLVDTGVIDAILRAVVRVCLRFRERRRPVRPR